MATRWSRLRGELYLARKSDDGEVSDVEEHTAVLWLGAIGPRRAVGLDFWLGGFGVPAERRRAEGRRNENGAASAFGQARGGFKALLRRQDVHGAWPARQKAGDGWRTRGVKLLRRSAMTVLKIF